MSGERKAWRKTLRPRAAASGQAGSVLVESAFTIMLLLVLVFGIIDFGRALYAYHFVASAAREATRYAAVRGSSCNTDYSCTAPADTSNSVVQDYVANITPPGIDPSKVTVTPVWPGNGTSACPSGSNSDGCPVQVEVSYNFNFLVPIGHSGSLPLSSSSEMVISH